MAEVYPLDFQNVYKIVYCGPLRYLDTLVQQIDRASVKKNILSQVVNCPSGVINQR